LIMGGVRALLDQQMERLSAVERAIMDWLAIAREPGSLAELRADLGWHSGAGALPEALAGLRRRFLVEKHQRGFTLQHVVMEYITEQLIARVWSEVVMEQPDVLVSHALMKAGAQEYVRQSQLRLILAPITARLLSTLGPYG